MGSENGGDGELQTGQRAHEFCPQPGNPQHLGRDPADPISRRGKLSFLLSLDATNSERQSHNNSLPFEVPMLDSDNPFLLTVICVKDTKPFQ